MGFSLEKACQISELLLSQLIAPETSLTEQQDLTQKATDVYPRLRQTIADHPLHLQDAYSANAV